MTGSHSRPQAREFFLWMLPLVFLLGYLVYKHMISAPKARTQAEVPVRPTEEQPQPRHIEAYLSNPRVAAAAGEKATRPSWESMARRQSTFPAADASPARQLVTSLPSETDEVKRLWRFFDNGRFKKLRAGAAAVVAQDPANLQAQFQLASALHNLERHREAIPILDHIIARAPGCIQVHLTRGMALLDTNKIDEAIIAFDRAEVIAPDLDINLNRGIALCDAGRFDEAERDLWLAAEGHPEEGSAFYHLAAVNSHRNAPGMAITMLRFAARNRDLFHERFSQRELMQEPLFEPLYNEPLFERYVASLPSRRLQKKR